MKDIINSIVIIFLLLGHVDFSTAQTEGVTGLKVGDKIPKEISEAIKRNNGEISKPTIINFWATWCVPCIKELKLLDFILKETSEIDILSVTYENEKTVESFFKRNNDLRSKRLTVLHSDTLFIKYFPHRALPHNVWITPDGIVKHITGGEEMTDKNIKSFLKGKAIDIKEKNDLLDFDPRKPFHLSDSQFVYRSILTERIDGIFSGATVSRSGFADRKKIKRLFSFNQTLNSMLWNAVSKGVSPDNYYNTMRIETSDSLRFFSPTQAPLTFAKSNYNSKQEWRQENTHCYELRLPKYISDTTFYNYMLDDLARNFNIKVEVVEDSILCSIITVDSSLFLPPEESDSTVLILSKDGLRAENVSILSLFQFLNETIKKSLNDKPIDPPFIDKTERMRVSIYLEFENGIPDYERLKQLIEEKYGIRVRHQKDTYKITVIKDMG